MVSIHAVLRKGIILPITMVLVFSLFLDVGLSSRASVIVRSTPLVAVGNANMTRLFVSGRVIKDNYGQIQLIGVNYDPLQGNTPLNDVIAKLQSLHINTVRLEVQWTKAEISNSPSEFVYDMSYINRSVATAKTLMKNGFYVVFDNHFFLGSKIGVQIASRFLPIEVSSNGSATFAAAFYTDRGPTSALEHLKRLWEIYVSKLHAQDGIAMYDLINEPYGTTTLSLSQRFELLWQIYEAVIGDIRQLGDNHIILIEPPANWNWRGMTRLVSDPLNNVAYSPHWYRGTYFSGVVGASYCVSNSSIAYLMTQFNKTTYLGPTILKFNAPFVIGEYGCLWDNKVADAKDQWMVNSQQIFRQFPTAGWIFYQYKEFSNSTWPERLSESEIGYTISTHQ